MKELILSIKVIPSAQKTESLGFLSDGTEKIRIKSAPENGKANQELIRFLSERAWGRWEILSGKTTKRKKVRGKWE